jgi:hypothetical protein
MRLVPENNPLHRLMVFPFGLLALFGFLAVRFATERVMQLAHCPLRDLTGLPCPTCGGTHAAVSLAHGRLAEAFSTSPLVAGGAILFALWLIAGVITTLVPAWRRSIELSPGEKRTARVLAVLIGVCGWIWVIRQSIS